MIMNVEIRLRLCIWHLDRRDLSIATYRATSRSHPVPATTNNTLLAAGAGERRRAQDLVDLRIGEDLLFAHDLEDALARLQRLGRQLGSLVVTDDGIERRHGPDARVHVMLEHVLV